MPSKLPMPATSIAPPPGPGFGFGNAMKAGLDAGAPLAQAAVNLKQMGIEEEKKQAAIGFQKLLRSGVDGMRAYAQEVTTQFPEIGPQIAQEAEQYATFFQDPSLTGDKAEQYASAFYTSANNRIKAIKDTKAAAAPKPYAPTTEDEAIRFDLAKKQNSADTRAPARGTSADAARSEKRRQALLQLPALWSQIEELQQGVPVPGEPGPDGKPTQGGLAVPLKPGTAKPDPAAYMAGMDPEQAKMLQDLRKQLNVLEATAGLEATKDLMGPAREQSASYRIYAGQGGGATSGRTAAAPARDPNEDALAWLRSPESRSNPYRKDVIAKLKKAGVDTGGL